MADVDPNNRDRWLKEAARWSGLAQTQSALSAGLSHPADPHVDQT
jgi:hypothetical protein